jgi:two-component system CheB/CheR fusion protein
MKKTISKKEQKEITVSTPVKQKISTSLSFPIVGIGASAGGLEALEQFFGNMPKDSGMAFVVIQHLDPTHAGIMPELLQRITPMKVFQATDHLNVRPNCLYVIPPNKSLSILNGALYLLDPVESRGLRLPVDIFFRALAIEMQERSVGIILSGMGSDGSLGLKAIKEKNGLVLVQDPATAKFDGMPGSAVKSVIPDIVAQAEDLPGKLITLLKFVPTTQPEIEGKTKSSLEKIILLLRQQSGHDFSLYKKNTLMRRIERRKGVHQIDAINNYVRLLQENPKEVEILFKELLIGVTSFFRDPGLWELLQENIFPELISQLPDGHIIRAWVPACSSGEEAYSLAIVFKEALEIAKTNKAITLQIFATDLDADSVEKARKGFFASNITVDVSPERISRFFTVEGDGYRVNTAIREMVVFALQNVIKDPPFTKLEILSCRNMLIYMEPELQKKLMALFHYSLNPGGIMVLGTAETLGNQNVGFTLLDNKYKVFKRSLSATENELIDFPSSFHHKPVEDERKTPVKPVGNIQSLTDQVLLQRFSPASVLVNDKGDILYITGRTGKYLEPAAGKANMNIFAMAREGLLNLLPGAIRKACQNFDAVYLQNIKVGTNGGTQYVDVTIQRLDKPDTLRGMILLLFADVKAKKIKGKSVASSHKPVSKEDQNILEAELQRSLEDLQSTREEMQTSQEELKSTNEELQSTNEELQSTNEELTTSKEEMQSLNEELQTVNIELQSKVSDYLQANDDMKNLLNSTEIATLFLDKELNIRRFTDEATHIFKLRNSDIGRPFTDLVTDMQYPEIENHARQVLKTLISVETQIATSDERWFNVRIMPYRKISDFIDGLVITFTNITTAKNLEIKLQAANETLHTKDKALAISETRFRRLFETSKDGILILDAETGKIREVNPFLVELLGYSRDQFMEKAIWEIGFLKDIVTNQDKFAELQKKEFVRYENLPLETADGRKINVEFISNVYSVENLKQIQCQIRERVKN